MKLNFKNKPNKKTIAIILAVVLICLVVPIAAHALFGIETAVARGVFSILGEILHTVLNWLVLAAAAFFDGMLQLGFSKNLDSVQKGWSLCRDVANMLFILFMIVIAFGTILKIENYGAKKLLPKVIIIALLINFSFVICSIIIDFTNIAANSFVTRIHNLVGDGEAPISTKFVDSFKLTNNEINFTNCDSYRKVAREYCESDEFRKTYDDTVENCYKNVERNYVDCQKDGSIKVDAPEQSFLTIISSSLIGSVILLIAAFTLFAGGIMLLIRIIAIWLLVTISPLAFICYIMPSLQSHWKKWWHTFINWCIFAPAYAFFVWLAIEFATQSTANRLSSSIVNSPTTSWRTLSSMLIINPGPELIRYAIMIAFLVGGLIIAKQLGIYGADVAMKIAKDARKGATNWAKRKTTGATKEWDKMGMGAAGRGFGTILKNVPGFKSTGRRMEASGKLLQQKAATTKEIEAYKKRLALMPSDDLMKEITMSHLRPSFRLAAVQSAQSRGDLAKTKNRDAVRAGINTLRGYGFEKEAGDLEEARFSAIQDKTKRKEIARKVKAKNIHKELKPIVFTGPAGYEAAADFASLEPTVSAAIETAKQMRTDTQKEYTRGLLASFINNNDFADKENIKLRSVYAALTGRLHHAFRDGQTGKVDKASLGEFVRRMKPRDFVEIDPASIPHIAEFIETATANDIGRGVISTSAKQGLIAKWNDLSTNPAYGPATNAKFTQLLSDLKTNPNWASLIH